MKYMVDMNLYISKRIVNNVIIDVFFFSTLPHQLESLQGYDHHCALTPCYYQRGCWAHGGMKSSFCTYFPWGFHHSNADSPFFPSSRSYNDLDRMCASTRPRQPLLTAPRHRQAAPTATAPAVYPSSVTSRSDGLVAIAWARIDLLVHARSLNALSNNIVGRLASRFSFVYVCVYVSMCLCSRAFICITLLAGSLVVVASL